ncbi:MAG: phosphate transport system regulatory protein PhoU [Verrucomicrobia bacterium SCN 57-15]|nr:MAG: phosphate transport system regulatory protein PhoU [Verrucomicrobia bacterium SCN 57-15]
MASHLEESLQRDIDRIRSKVTEMAQLAESALEASLRALVESKRRIAYSIILRDQRIDALEQEIDRLCLEFLVRQQPVARHLRFAYVTIKINQEVERIGDYAESIARQILKVAGIDGAVPLERYRQIAGLAIPMFRDAVQAYLTEDGELARRVWQVEEQVDDLRNILNAELVQLRQDNKIPLEALTPLMTIARRFERVSDQAKNICEETLYMITGAYQKHAAGETWRVLFIDVHNSCRSQMAEAIATALHQPKFHFASAGLDPKPVDSLTLSFLKEKGLDISGMASRPVESVPNLESYQIVIALAAEAKRAFPTKSKSVCLDWSVPDPLRVQGSTAEVKRAFEQTYQHLHDQINDLVEGILADKID